MEFNAFIKKNNSKGVTVNIDLKMINLCNYLEIDKQLKNRYRDLEDPQLFCSVFALVVGLLRFSMFSSATRLYRGWVPRLTDNITRAAT